MERRNRRKIGPGRRALCAVSGGVDSAVAAGLLLKAGYEVTGAFVKCYEGETADGSCWIGERRDALRICAKLGIQLLTFNFEKEFHRFVIDYLLREYKAGRTPNPDVMCNKFVKFPLLLRQVKKMGFDYLATGHYAGVKTSAGRLWQAVDKTKDQTYFLHQFKQNQLKKILFPLSDFTKKEVRLLAKDWGLPVADKEESMGICFIGEISVRKFLKKRIKSQPGPIVFADGKTLGRHDGLAFYTIGQRLGNVINKRSRSPGRTLYVVDKRPEGNELVAGEENDALLYKKEAMVNQVNWISGQSPKFPLKCEVRLRHGQDLQKAVIRNFKSKIKVKFARKQRAIAPGQFAVFYRGGECLGGGEITEF